LTGKRPAAPCGTGRRRRGRASRSLPRPPRPRGVRS